MHVGRLLRHLLVPHWWRVRRAFGRGTLAAIEAAIAGSERRHRGEVRFVAEGALPLADLLAGTGARERALDLFSRLRIWDTVENSGILIYVQLADRRVEIVADRGIAKRVAQADWDAICRDMEGAFARGDYRGGAVDAVRKAEDLLAAHFPAAERNPNELPNRPLVL